MAGANAVAGLPASPGCSTPMLLGFIVALYALCRGQGGILAAAARHRRRMDRGGRQPEPEAAGVRVHPAGGLVGRLAPHGTRRPHPLVAPPAHLALGLRPRDLAVRGGADGALRHRHAAGPQGRATLRVSRCGRPRRGPGGCRDAHPSRSSAALGAARDLSDQPVHQRVEADVDHRPARRGDLLMGLVVMVVWIRGASA